MHPSEKLQSGGAEHLDIDEIEQDLGKNTYKFQSANISYEMFRKYDIQC